ncbi:tetratricopeptide repeat protein [Marinobacterium sp. YM272]|uniref:tetratricopeptide repeat protein n=1 Tax=Marinobacterium sp. YM272 TaxID=3421654 RepID=UPI003D7F32F3
MNNPRTGMALTTDSEQAAQDYLDAVDRILGSESGARELLDRALEQDPNFALAWVARYMLAKDGNDPAAEDFRVKAQAQAEQAAPWEQVHTEVLIGLLADPYGNLQQTEAYVAANPADLLIISQLSGYLIFYGGPEKLTRVLNILKASEETLADDWAFLARLGFAISEAGDPAQGRKIQERALQLRPQSLYTIHGYAHILHDLGVPDEAETLIHSWLDLHKTTAEGGALYGHLQWHLALAEWQVGKRDEAWERYQRYCAPETTTCGPVLTLADCGGFLLRDYLKTGKTSALTPAVKELTARFEGMLAHPFIALHIAGIHAATGNLSGLESCEALIRGKDVNSNRDLALLLVEAVSHFARSDFQQAAQLLGGISSAQRIGVGGSRVERMLIDLLEEKARERAA